MTEQYFARDNGHVKPENIEKIPPAVVRFLQNRLSKDSKSRPYDKWLYHILVDRRLSTTDKIVGVVVWIHADIDTGGNSFPSLPLICFLSGLKRRAAQYALRRLEKHGYLVGKTRYDPTERQQSSAYTLLVEGSKLDAIPKRTLVELLHLLNPDSATQPEVGGRVHGDARGGARGCTGEGARGCTPLTFHIEPSQEHTVSSVSYETYETDYPETAFAGVSVLGRTDRNKVARQKSGGRSTFEFEFDETALEETFSRGVRIDTSDVTDSEVLQTLKTSTGNRIGKNLLTKEAVAFCRIMIGAIADHVDCDVITALEHLQSKLWQRVGNQPDTVLNCFSLVFKPICADLRMNDMHDHVIAEHIAKAVAAKDHAKRLHHRALKNMDALQLLIDCYGEELVLETIAAELASPGGSEREMRHIHDWSYFEPALERSRHFAAVHEAGLAVGDVKAFGLVPGENDKD